MVRVNLINPKHLADQHLVAEYLEILMLVGYVKKHPALDNIPPTYRLGPGHIRFFKNKLAYLRKRHDRLKAEMKKRGYKPSKELIISCFDKQHCKDWRPTAKDKAIIKDRLIERVKRKPTWYTYYKEHKPLSFYVKLIRTG